VASRGQRSAAWRRSHRLAIWVFRLSRRLPSVEQHALVAELRRAAAAIPALISAHDSASSAAQKVELLQTGRQRAFDIDALLDMVSALAYLHPFQVGLMRREAREIIELLDAQRQNIERGANRRTDSL